MPLSVEAVPPSPSVQRWATARKRAGGKGERVQESGRPADSTHSTDSPLPSHNARPRGCANNLWYDDAAPGAPHFVLRCGLGRRMSECVVPFSDRGKFAVGLDHVWNSQAVIRCLPRTLRSAYPAESLGRSPDWWRAALAGRPPVAPPSCACRPVPVLRKSSHKIGRKSRGCR